MLARCRPSRYVPHPQIPEAIQAKFEMRKKNPINHCITVNTYVDGLGEVTYLAINAANATDHVDRSI